MTKAQPPVVADDPALAERERRQSAAERYLAELRAALAEHRAASAPPSARVRDGARLLADGWDHVLGAFDPTKHPRYEKGKREGGRFRRKEEEGGTDAPAPAEEGFGGGPMTMADAEKQVATMAEYLQFPVERIRIEATPGPEFMVGDAQFREAGHYSPFNDEIVLHANGFRYGAKSAAGLIAHEIQHARFSAVVVKGLREFYSNPQHIQWLTPSGEFTREGARRFPTIARVAKAWGDGDPERFKDEDGVSDYSTSYWRMYARASERRRAIGESAINETLSEMAADHWQTGIYPGRASRPKLRELYDAINAAYTGTQRTALGLPAETDR